MGTGVQELLGLCGRKGCEAESPSLRGILGWGESGSPFWVGGAGCSPPEMGLLHLVEMLGPFMHGSAMLV